MPTSAFAFVLCQPGAEAPLKRELARTAPTLAPAFQRPGLVTLKSPTPLRPDFRLDSAFARAYGLSLGTAADPTDVLARIAEIAEPLVLHVAERPSARAEAASFLPSPPSDRAQAIASLLRDAAPRRFLANTTAPPGALVLTLSFAGDEPWLVGVHRHGPDHVPFAGGVYPIAVPDAAPSRAYAKIEEAIAHFGLDVRAGETVLELGAAPGGAAYAMLQRGLSIIAVDPGEMAPSLGALRNPAGATLVHHAFKASALTAAHLPRPVTHLLVDVHLAPPVALRGLRKALSLVRGTVRNVVWTVKLNDWSMAEALPEHVAELRALGVRDARARQLVANRQEVCVAGRLSR